MGLRQTGRKSDILDRIVYEIANIKEKYGVLLITYLECLYRLTQPQGAIDAQRARNSLRTLLSVVNHPTIRRIYTHHIDGGTQPNHNEKMIPTISEPPRGPSAVPPPPHPVQSYSVNCVCKVKTNPSSSLIYCSDCSTLHHSSCYGMGYLPSNGNICMTKKIVCCFCRSLLDPFTKVIRTIHQPTYIPPSQAPITNVIDFKLSEEDFSFFNNPRNRPLLYLRTFDLHHAEHEGHLWPMETSINCNSRSLEIKQRFVYVQLGVRKYKGSCSPLDIYPRVRTNQYVH